MTKHIAAPTPATPATISTAQLESLSNLGERRLRQLAQEGKLPQPTGGHWPMILTIKRLFAVYQESGPELAKEKLLKMAAQRKLAELEVARVTGLFVPRAEIGPILRNLSLNQRACLQNILENEMPAKLSGLDAITIRARMVETTDKICGMFQTCTRQWLDGPPPPPQV
jgi:hypothetical protein